MAIVADGVKGALVDEALAVELHPQKLSTSGPRVGVALLLVDEGFAVGRFLDGLVGLR